MAGEFLTGFSVAAGIELVTSVANLGGFVGSYAVGLIQQKTGNSWWGEIQVGLARCRLMRAAGSQEWSESARVVHCEAIAAGYSRDAAFASELLNGQLRPRNVLMFL